MAPESCLGPTRVFPPGIPHLQDASSSLGWGVQAGTSNGFFFQITACVFNVRLDAKFWIGYVGCSESSLALAVLGQKK